MEFPIFHIALLIIGTITFKFGESFSEFISGLTPMASAEAPQPHKYYKTSVRKYIHSIPRNNDIRMQPALKYSNWLLYSVFHLLPSL